MGLHVLEATPQTHSILRFKMALIGDSSDRPIPIPCAGLSQFEAVRERVEKGWALRPAEAMLLLRMALWAIEFVPSRERMGFLLTNTTHEGGFR